MLCSQPYREGRCLVLGLEERQEKGWYCGGGGGGMVELWWICGAAAAGCLNLRTKVACVCVCVFFGLEKERKKEMVVPEGRREEGGGGGWRRTMSSLSRHPLPVFFFVVLTSPRYIQRKKTNTRAGEREDDGCLTFSTKRAPFVEGGGWVEGRQERRGTTYQGEKRGAGRKRGGGVVRGKRERERGGVWGIFLKFFFWGTGEVKSKKREREREREKERQ